MYYFLTIIGFLLFSCSETKQGKLPEIPVDIDQNTSLPLSEIVEELTAIELELTNESLINTDYIGHIIISENEVIIADLSKILVFNKDGKFIRTIGSRGQGPGEYNYIKNLAMDETNKRLFVISSGPSKIISYDMDGNYLKESVNPIQSTWFTDIVDVNYVDDELLLVVDRMDKDEAKGAFQHPAVYRLNNDVQIIDSCTIRTIYLGKTNSFAILYGYRDFILQGNTSVYLFYSDIYSKKHTSAERALCDTLYCFEEMRLVPELKLKFKNEGMDGVGSKFIDLYNIYRSSRYIFSIYRNNLNKNSYRFCYDTKTGKGYNMQDGYTDDINQIKERVSIRPFNLDTEMFYYLQTNMKPDDLEEPNPTLYIGKLKK
jgi:hypothetical protein